MLSARRTLLATLLSLAAALLSIALLLKHYGVGTPVDAICGSEPQSGCDIVNQSAYSKLAGVPLAALGLVFYVWLGATLGLATLASDAARAGIGRLATLALALSLAVDLLLFGLQATRLHAYCVLCILTYALGAGALAALFASRRAEIAPALAAGEGRLALAGGAAAGVVAVAIVATYQVALQARPASPAAMLGVAAMSGTATGGDELSRARQEIQKLQATLDDPQKLEQYFSDKALHEFESGPVQSLDLGGVPFKGPAEAPLKVVEFSDFLCPYCRQLAEGFHSFLPQTAGRMALYYKQYPMDNACNDSLKQQVHQGACTVSLGGLCAVEQDKFWPFHDRVFARQGQATTRQDLIKVAGEAGLDAAAFGACLDRPATMEKLRAHIREGTAAGVKGTPTVFINGRRVTRMNDFVAMIDKESARLGLPPLPKPAPPRR
jgi:serine/threonine-protein kinase